MERHRTQCRPAGCNRMLAHGGNIQRSTTSMPDQRTGKRIMQRSGISTWTNPVASRK
jgi:hypothetical protein